MTVYVIISMASSLQNWQDIYTSQILTVLSYQLGRLGLKQLIHYY